MTAVKVPANVSSLTVSGTVHTPSAGSITPANDTLSTVLSQWTTRPKIRNSLANGDVVITLPSVISSITIAGTVYTPNAAGDITVPAAPATAFMHETKYIP